MFIQSIKMALKSIMSNTMRSFLTMLGVIIGTLTSMFVAAPVAYLVMGRKIKEEE